MDLWKQGAKYEDIVDWLIKAGLESWYSANEDMYRSKKAFLKDLVKHPEKRPPPDTIVEMMVQDYIGDAMMTKLEAYEKEYFKWVLINFFKEELAKNNPDIVSELI